MNLAAAWNALMARLPEQVLTLATMVGVSIIVWAIASFFWRNRDASKERRFSWGALIAGLLIAGPTVSVPVALVIIEATWAIVVRVVTGG